MERRRGRWGQPKVGAGGWRGRVGLCLQANQLPDPLPRGRSCVRQENRGGSKTQVGPQWQRSHTQWSRQKAPTPFSLSTAVALSAQDPNNRRFTRHRLWRDHTTDFGGTTPSPTWSCWFAANLRRTYAYSRRGAQSENQSTSGSQWKAQSPLRPSLRWALRAEAPGPDSPSSLLTALGDLSCIVISDVGWSAARANSQ